MEIRKIIGLAALGLAAFAARGDAATVSYKTSFTRSYMSGHGGANGTFATFELPRFDGDLGKLRSVTSFGEAEWHFAASWDGDGVQAGYVQLSFHFDPYNIAGVADHRPAPPADWLIPAFQSIGEKISGVPYFDVQIRDGVRGAIDVSSTWRSGPFVLSTYDADPAALSYISMGGPLQVSYQDYQQRDEFRENQGEPKYVNWSQSTTWTYGVTYDYGVPEPSTWLCFGAGFFALGFTLRSRRRRESRSGTHYRAVVHQGQLPAET